MSFAWVSISWMAIPWHQATFSHFKEESAMATAIKAAAEEPGIYLYPSWEDADGNKPQPDVIAAKMKEGPMVFASIVPGGMEMKMGSMMLKGICMHAVAAFDLGTRVGCSADYQHPQYCQRSCPFHLFSSCNVCRKLNRLLFLRGHELSHRPPCQRPSDDRIKNPKDSEAYRKGPPIPIW